MNENKIKLRSRALVIRKIRSMDPGENNLMNNFHEFLPSWYSTSLISKKIENLVEEIKFYTWFTPMSHRLCDINFAVRKHFSLIGLEIFVTFRQDQYSCNGFSQSFLLRLFICPFRENLV